MATCECGAEINAATKLPHMAGRSHRDWAAKNAIEDISRTDVAPETEQIDYKALYEALRAQKDSPEPTVVVVGAAKSTEMPEDVADRLNAVLARMNDRGFRGTDKQLQEIAKTVRGVFNEMGWMDDPNHESVADYLRRNGVPLVAPRPQGIAAGAITATDLRP